MARTLANGHPGAQKKQTRNEKKTKNIPIRGSTFEAAFGSQNWSPNPVLLIRINKGPRFWDPKIGPKTGTKNGPRKSRTGATAKATTGLHQARRPVSVGSLSPPLNFPPGLRQANASSSCQRQHGSLAYLALAVVTSRSNMLRLPSDCPMPLQPTQMASRLQEVSNKNQPSRTINEKFGGGRLRPLRGTKTRPLKSAISATKTQSREHSGGLARLRPAGALAALSTVLSMA